MTRGVIGVCGPIRRQSEGMFAPAIRRSMQCFQTYGKSSLEQIKNIFASL
jgi:hypothetical protein